MQNSQNSEKNIQLDRDLMLECLKEVAKEYHKQFKGGDIEIVIVGGASLALNYNFRPGTTDIDAYIVAREDLKDIINKVGDRRNLPTGWLNQDFKKTTSFSPNLRQYSKYYATYSHCMEIRTVKDEYIIAMKLASYRPYKHDQSDIIGVLIENEKQGNSISFEKINEAVINLYGDWDGISTEAKEMIEGILNVRNLGEIYNDVQKIEAENLKTLSQFEESYPEILNENNINEILNKRSNSELPTIDDLINQDNDKEEVDESSDFMKHINAVVEETKREQQATTERIKPAIIQDNEH